MKSKKIHQFRSKTGLSLLVAIGALLLFNTRSQAQVECQIPGYKIIVGDFDAPDLYGAQLTPPQPSSEHPSISCNRRENKLYRRLQVCPRVRYYFFR